VCVCVCACACVRVCVSFLIPYTKSGICTNTILTTANSCRNIDFTYILPAAVSCHCEIKHPLFWGLQSCGNMNHILWDLKFSQLWCWRFRFFWDVTFSIVVVDSRCFEGEYRLHLLGLRSPKGEMKWNVLFVIS